MDAQTRAGIDIYGRVLRYAEVQRLDGRYRLLRLGVCEFDFDVVEAVLAAEPAHLEALSDALADVFEGSGAGRLYVVVHPPVCYSFFAPLPVDVSDEQRKQHLLRDAALLTRADVPQPLRLTADPVYSETLPGGEAVEWYHVLALDERLYTRFDRILRLLPQSHHRMTLSMHAVANAVERLERKAGPVDVAAAPFTLAIGGYASHIELTLCRHSSWYFSHHTEAGGVAEAGDAAYFALALLHRLGLAPRQVGRLLLYGHFREAAGFEALAEAVGTAPQPLDPLPLLDLDPHSMAAADEMAAYAPCLGVAF